MLLEQAELRSKRNQFCERWLYTADYKDFKDTEFKNATRLLQ